MKWLNRIYLNNFTWYVFIGILVCFVLAYIFPALYHATWLLFYIFLGFLAIDFLFSLVDNDNTPLEMIGEGVLSFSNVQKFLVSLAF